LDFKQSVEIPKVLSVLKKAKSNGFGELQVDLGSIQAISDDQLPSSTQGPSSTVETTTSGTVAESFVSPVFSCCCFCLLLFLFF